MSEFNPSSKPFIDRTARNFTLPGKPLPPVPPQPTYHIPYSDRQLHVYIAGASRHGKSTYMERMIAEDMAAGEGLTILDPKGDLAELAILRVPEHRKDDCIYIDIANPIPINFMSWQNDLERQRLLGDVFQTFKDFSTQVSGDQWLSILRWTIHTLLASQSASFLDIYYFLARADRQREILNTIERKNDGVYDDILDYWQKEFPHLKSPREGPILTRMSVFTTTPPLKTMLGTVNASFDIFEAMQQKKIIITNLYGVAEETGNLVAALLTTRIQQAAFRRKSKESRVAHFLYADEFENFQTMSFDTILSKAAGFGLYLTMANQGFYQLDQKIKQLVFANVTGARIAFRVSHEDVSNWKYLLPSDPDSYNYIDPISLSDLAPYWAMFKIGRNPPEIGHAPYPLPEPTAADHARAEYIKQRTLAQYGLKRAVDNSSCNSSEVLHTEDNDDEPQPGAAPSGH
jgi:hypothetical protein